MFKFKSVKAALFLGAISATGSLQAADACPFSVHDFVTGIFTGADGSVKADNMPKGGQVHVAGKDYDLNVTDPAFDAELAKLKGPRLDRMFNHIAQTPAGNTTAFQSFSLKCDAASHVVRFEFMGLPAMKKFKFVSDPAKLEFEMHEVVMAPPPPVPPFQAAPKYQRPSMKVVGPQVGEKNQDGLTWNGNRWVRR